MDISLEATDPVTLVAISGDVDADNCTELGAALRSIGLAQDLMIDVAAVTFIDSSGISELLSAQRDMESAGYSLRLQSPSVPVRRVLEITGLLEVFGLSEKD